MMTRGNPIIIPVAPIGPPNSYSNLWVVVVVVLVVVVVVVVVVPFTLAGGGALLVDVDPCRVMGGIVSSLLLVQFY